MATSSGPLVSIIIPSFNQGPYLGETLKSCLEQAYRPIEVLVLDGGSTDETMEVLRRCGTSEVRWWSEPDRGPVDAMNKGLSRASGLLLSIQSSDDVFAPGAIGAAVEAFALDPGLGLAYGDVEHIDASSRVTGADIQGGFDLAECLGRLSYIPQCGAFFSRPALLATGPWREAVSFAADADFFLRMALRWRVRKLDRIMARYRYHPEQRDRYRSAIARDWEALVRELLQTRALNRRQRRYAIMGIHLARYRYAGDDQWWLRTRQLYAAAARNPRAVLDKRFPKRELLPGRTPIWRFLSRAKRWLGIRPRSGTRTSDRGPTETS